MDEQERNLLKIVNAFRNDYIHGRITDIEKRVHTVIEACVSLILRAEVGTLVSEGLFSQRSESDSSASAAAAASYT